MSANTSCETCGAPLTRGRRGPAPKYCSASCRAHACNERARADGRFDAWLQTSRSRRQKPKTEVSCIVCAREFLTARPSTARLCGRARCRRVYNRRRAKAYYAKRKMLIGQ